MDAMAGQAAALASRGYLAVTPDCRYHGLRNTSGTPDFEAYQTALVAAWRGSGEHPFLLDNVWDLMAVADYLIGTRPREVDASRMAATGVSLGAMHAWLWAAADPRVAAVAPIIGVQSFKYAVEKNCFHGRVSSIPRPFFAAAEDLGKRGVDAEVVTRVWNRLVPGLLDAYDAPLSLPLIAPRPLLVLNGGQDPRCPIEGVYAAMQSAMAAYDAAGAPDNVDLVVEESMAHTCTPTMWAAVHAWLDGHLLTPP